MAGPLPPVNLVVRMDFHYLLNGAVNALFRKFFKYTGALSLGDAQTWVNAASTSWGAHLKTNTHPSATLTSVVLTDLTSPSSAQAVAGTPIAGTSGSGLIPNGFAVVLKNKIARRYRGGHPRTYIPGLTNGFLAADDQIDPTAAATLLTAWNAFVSDILTNVPALAAPATEVNVSYFQGFSNFLFPSGREKAIPTRRVTPVVDTILSHSINPLPGSQRRRNHQSS